MTLRGCCSSHYIRSIKDGIEKKVQNMDSYGRPGPKFMKLEDIYQKTDAEYNNNNSSMPNVERKTRAENGYVAAEIIRDCVSNENNFEELTLSQLRKKCKRIKRKASESVLLTPKAENDDDTDLAEPLCKFRIKATKISRSKTVPANGNNTSFRSKDHATVKVKVEVPEAEYFSEHTEMTCMVDESSVFVASESGFIIVNHGWKRRESEPFTTEGEFCQFNEVSYDGLDDIKNMELDHEEHITKLDVSFTEYPATTTSDCSQSQLYIQQTPEPVNHLSGIHDSGSAIDSPTSMPDYLCSPSKSHIWPTPDDYDGAVSMEAKSSISSEQQHLTSVNTDANSFNSDNISFVSKDGQPSIVPANGYSEVNMYLNNQTEHVNCIPGVQDSNSTIDSAISMLDYSCLPSKSHIWPTPDDHDEDIVSMEAKSSSSNEKQQLTSVNTDANSFNSDNNSFVSKDVSIHQPSIVPENGYSEVNMDLDNQTDASEIRNSIGIRHPERLPLTRKVISPNSQEKLCQAMKSDESLDDMDHFKCKEKLYFGEQTESKYTSNKLDADGTEPNMHRQQAKQCIPNKVITSTDLMLKRSKNYKKVSPTEKYAAPKGSLDGPRLCRSLPRLSTGCTSIAGCSESAIAFSQRQMHDIETLASKLMSELNSMKSIVEEKMLYEAYRSASLKNEADEVKSAIKSATRTGETAKKWLSMMARDCSRFCKIMKLNEDNNTSAADADPALGVTNQEKPLQKEGKKISFADEAGGTLCDIKVYQIERDSLEVNEKPEPSLV